MGNDSSKCTSWFCMGALFMAVMMDDFMNLCCSDVSVQIHHPVFVFLCFCLPIVTVYRGMEVI